MFNDVIIFQRNKSAKFERTFVLDYFVLSFPELSCSVKKRDSFILAVFSKLRRLCRMLCTLVACDFATEP